eukprot:GILK01015818.1.p1 GENE.GILK01015818.1~~GILK01015818.1.p1  ORF type:complete len:246 (+),score=36.53 GILK01015818.1:200-937(+)
MSSLTTALLLLSEEPIVESLEANEHIVQGACGDLKLRNLAELLYLMRSDNKVRRGAKRLAADCTTPFFAAVALRLLVLNHFPSSHMLSPISSLQDSAARAVAEQHYFQAASFVDGRAYNGSLHRSIRMVPLHERPLLDREESRRAVHSILQNILLASDALELVADHAYLFDLACHIFFAIAMSRSFKEDMKVKVIIPGLLAPLRQYAVSVCRHVLADKTQSHTYRSFANLCLNTLLHPDQVPSHL